MVACEESQTVMMALKAQGHIAYSCDLLPTSGPRPDCHIQRDIKRVLYSTGEWDAVIAFPPCTDLAVSGARHFAKKKEEGSQQKAIDFFMWFVAWHKSEQKPLVIENPIGIMSQVYRPPSQIIQPWQFGHKASKATCLWVHGLPPLMPTSIVGPPKKYKDMSRAELAEWTAIHRCPPGPDRARIRSKTYQGIADAMAQQWFPEPRIKFVTK